MILNWNAGIIEKEKCLICWEPFDGYNCTNCWFLKWTNKDQQELWYIIKHELKNEVCRVLENTRKWLIVKKWNYSSFEVEIDEDWKIKIIRFKNENNSFEIQIINYSFEKKTIKDWQDNSEYITIDIQNLEYWKIERYMYGGNWLPEFPWIKNFIIRVLKEYHLNSK